MGYNYNYGGNNLGSTLTSTANQGIGSLIWVIIAFVVSLIGCFVIYFIFVNNKNEEKNKYLAWLNSFLKFDKMLIETILKIAYIFCALFLTLGSFALISSSFVSFLIVIIFGNLMARVMYELSLIRVMTWKNTNEIKEKLKK